MKKRLHSKRAEQHLDRFLAWIIKTPPPSPEDLLRWAGTENNHFLKNTWVMKSEEDVQNFAEMFYFFLRCSGEDIKKTLINAKEKTFFSRIENLSKSQSKVFFLKFLSKSFNVDSKSYAVFESWVGEVFQKMDKKDIIDQVFNARDRGPFLYVLNWCLQTGTLSASDISKKTPSSIAFWSQIDRDLINQKITADNIPDVAFEVYIYTMTGEEDLEAAFPPSTWEPFKEVAKARHVYQVKKSKKDLELGIGLDKDNTVPTSSRQLKKI